MTWFMTPYNIVSLTVTISIKYNPFYETRSCAASQFSRLYGAGFHPEPNESILRSVYLIKNFSIIIILPFLPPYLQLFCSREVFQSNFCMHFSSDVRGTCVCHFIIRGFIVLINVGEDYGLWSFSVGLINFEEYIFIHNKWFENLWDARKSKALGKYTPCTQRRL